VVPYSGQTNRAKHTRDCRLNCRTSAGSEIVPIHERCSARMYSPSAPASTAHSARSPVDPTRHPGCRRQASASSDCRLSAVVNHAPRMRPHALLAIIRRESPGSPRRGIRPKPSPNGSSQASRAVQPTPARRDRCPRFRIVGPEYGSRAATRRSPRQRSHCRPSRYPPPRSNTGAPSAAVSVTRDPPTPFFPFFRIGGYDDQLRYGAVVSSRPLSYSLRVRRSSVTVPRSSRRKSGRQPRDVVTRAGARRGSARSGRGCRV